MATPDQRPVHHHYTIHLTGGGPFRGMTYVVSNATMDTAQASAQGVPRFVHVADATGCGDCAAKPPGVKPEGWDLWRRRAERIAHAGRVHPTATARPQEAS